MYGLLRNVIVNGRYRLSEMVEKINTMWGESMITDGQRAELLELAQRHLNPATETPEQEELYRRVLEKYEALEARVTAIEQGGAGGETGGGASDAADWPEWEPWDGISDRYQPGAQVTHNGVRYVSVYSGQNVWEPGAPGTQALWQAQEAGA